MLFQNETALVTGDDRDGSTAWRRTARAAVSVAAVTAVVVAGLGAAPAGASSVTSAVFSGAAGTLSSGGALYARSGAGVALTLVTTADTQCVDVAGAFTAHQTSSSGTASWTFTTTAGAGDGAQAVTVSASPSVNPQGKCTGATQSTQASYVLDNTGPIVSGALTPAPSATGWNNSNVTVKWTAMDSGVGVSAVQPFQTDTVSASGITTRVAPAQSDRLGNTGAAGSVTVRVDKTAPAISAQQTKNADGTTTVSFTCDDGAGDASGIATCLADGSTTNAKTVQPGVTVTGTATDKAGNTAKASSTAPAGDTTAPVLTGAPTTEPNASGWYRDDVTVRWTAADPESGIPTPPADTTIGGEGTALTSSKTVTNGVGLSTTTTSSPAVSIDRTAPTTAITGTSNGWVKGDVTISLAAKDNLSGIASTSYAVDGGTAQSGNSVTLSTDGQHAITFHSTDKAGNVESEQTATVKLDKTAPTIGHVFTPPSYTDGAWTNEDVTVTFACADQGGSVVADCTEPVTKTAEGTYAVDGTVTDGAGNTASDVASVRIDKTAPVVTASAAGSKNAAGWYQDAVTVTFSASDALSGVVGEVAPVVLGEGAAQAASVTVRDAAGNAASAGVRGINVDTTAPVLTAKFGNAWVNGDVVVDWSCTDALSGVAVAPVADTVTGEGDALTSTASCTDKAGNTTTKTVGGIKIDRTPPTTTASVRDALPSGWYGDDVEVSLSATDNLSGVAETYYTVDGGPRQTYSGAFSLGEGGHSVRFWSVDDAGNLETVGVPLSLDVDKTPPTTTVVNPISPDSGWFVMNGIPVAFQAIDSRSGIKATYYSIDGGVVQEYGKPFMAELSTGAHTITYWSEDLAGNVEAHGTTNTVAVNVDTDAPTITGHATPSANAFGWNNTAVQVSFQCDDVGSGLRTGIAGCAGDTTLANDGPGQKVHGDAVDVAGNRSATDVTDINIDTTRPTLVGVPADANGAGWYHSDVTVGWVGDDGLSGIDPATQPAASTVTGEGSNLGAGPVTIKDRAGNESNPANVSGLKIDRTKPSVTGAAISAPNASGWYKDSVLVDFVCTDPKLADGTNGSGVASCPSSKVLSGDGVNQSVTSGSARDVAGNEAAGTTVGGIDIDGSAPSTVSNNMCTAANGWCTGSTADVLLTATDQAGLSGVKEIHFAVDGGAEQVATGANATVSVPLTGSGAGTVKYWAVDRAGNVEAPNGVALKWDNIAPTVTHTLSPTANVNDWNNTGTTVTFTAKDDDKGSGVASVTAPVTITGETAGQVVTGTAKDTAGNLGTDSVTVKVDKTPPSVAGAVASGTKGLNGWYTGPVTVAFTCSDALSSVATCSDQVTLTSNGAAQSVAGTAYDRAGNSATTTVSGIDIDQEKPTLTTADVNVQGGSYSLGTAPKATCTATDSISGLTACTVVVTGGNANGVGTFSYTATATDKAGNARIVTGTYRVTYRWDGFLQPINDTAHQTDTSTSVFKAGSTVPAKFQLKRADGTLVQAATAPIWLTPVKGGSTSAPVDESVYAATADSGLTFRYDATAQQYIYNWKTGAGGNYWRMGVTLDDGQTYCVNIGLR